MKIYLLFISICCLSVSFAQLSTEKRIEFELKDGYQNENVYEFGDKGFLLIARSQKSDENREVAYKIERYDADLNMAQTNEINIDKSFSIDETYRDDSHIYQLYKNRKGEYSIVKIDAANLEYKSIEGEFPSKTYVKDMAILGDFAYLTANKGGKPCILSIDLKSGLQNFMPITIEGFNSKKLLIESMQLLEESNEIFVFIEAVKSKKESYTYIVRMDNNGNIKDTYNFSNGFTEIITSATASYIENDTYVISGTYSTKTRYTSEGMFFSIVSNNAVQSINFYNFLDLDNFLKYLPERKQEKIEKKKSRKDSKGKDYNLRYYLAPHHIIKTDDGYIFLAEAYYPTYRTETYTTTSFVNGQAVTTTQTRQVFDGYQYTHAFFAKFSKSGEMQWDQTFEMWMAYKPFYVKRFINIAEQSQNAIKLVFASYNRIASKSFDFDGNITTETSSDEIETGIEGDKTKGAFSNISFWYDKYFLAYGSQTIKNTDDGDGKRKRKVYFVNKIRFE